MAADQEKLLIDEQETVQIKDLNKVTTVENDHLLLIDDGVASCNAITFKKFLETAKDKTFKGEGLDYFKEIIKSTIAEELAADTSFVKKIYDQTLNKLIDNDSDKLSSLFSKIKSRLSDSISSATLSRSDDLLIMSSSTIQKTPIPKQLLGIPSNFEYTGRASRTTLYPSDYEGKAVAIDLENHTEAELIFFKSYDNDPIYLDIEVVLKITSNTPYKKSLNLKYSDETTYNWVYECQGPRELYIRIPLYQGWYVQKRAYMYGDPVPALAKL
ncbi:DUF685 domain-containing protein (plasmid) [Borreliella yangtzensis]|uniref:DUF685 domain-containing protein n=1 Tax=Borreliella yangtzensis TaxID=683292 RepID=UPI003B20E8FC